MNASTKKLTPEDKWHSGRQADAFFGLLDQYNALLEESVALRQIMEDLARQHCHTSLAGRDYNGQVANTLVTDSGALTANSIALRRLAKDGKFRIVAEHGRMVVGYWPENDPQKQETQP